MKLRLPTRHTIKLFACITLLLSACGTELSDQEYVSRAKDALDKGELRSASIYLKNALAQNPNNAEARWLLGKAHLDIGDGGSAEKELLRAR